ncbi:MAG: hypothetical protein ACO24D_16165, partial [bacterium]
QSTEKEHHDRGGILARQAEVLEKSCFNTSQYSSSTCYFSTYSPYIRGLASFEQFPYEILKS